MDHCEIGHCIAQAWQLPELLCAGIAQHHQLQQHPPLPLVAAVNLAETLCNAQDMPNRAYNQVIRVDEAALEALGLDWANDVGSLLGRIEARFRQDRAALA